MTRPRVSLSTTLRPASLSLPLAITVCCRISAAPYFTDEIQVSPEPIVVGVPSTIGATLTNPNSFPVTVDVTFSFQGAHIGLPFLPVGEVTGTVIPANSTATVMVVWLPTASGHYCFSIEAIATSPLRAVANSGQLKSTAKRERSAGAVSWTKREECCNSSWSSNKLDP